MELVVDVNQVLLEPGFLDADYVTLKDKLVLIEVLVVLVEGPGIDGAKLYHPLLLLVPLCVLVIDGSFPQPFSFSFGHSRAVYLLLVELLEEQLLGASDP